MKKQFPIVLALDIPQPVQQLFISGCILSFHFLVLKYTSMFVKQIKLSQEIEMNF